jgi:hypothetical protein
MEMAGATFQIIAYKRVCEEDTILVALNAMRQPRLCDWQGQGTLRLSTDLDGEQQDLAGPTLLWPDEGIIVELRT